MSPNDKSADFALISLIDLHRVGNSMLIEIRQELEDLEGEVVAMIRVADPTGTPRAASQRRRLADLLEEIEAKIDEVTKEITERLEEDFQLVADRQAEKERDNLAAIFSLEGLDVPDIKAAEMVIIGATLAQWFEALGTNLKQNVSRVLTEGVDSGFSGSQLADAMRGDVEGVIAPRPIVTATRTAESTVQTAMDTLLNDLTLEVAETNKLKIRYAWQQISILDSRTTTICRNYAYRIWDKDFKPIGHNLPFNGGPPRHNYCRSRVVMITLDEDETADGVSHQSMQQWLKGRPESELNRAFGKTRVELWKLGKITDADLIRGAIPLPLDSFLKAEDTDPTAS